MTTRTYAAWVEPVADRLRENRAQVLSFARAQPREAWATPSPLEGWSCKDLLAHIGGGNDGLFQKILRAVAAREPLDAALLQVDTDGENARGVEKRHSWPVERVIEELETTGDEVQQLLASLRNEDKELRHGDAPISLGQFIDIVYAEDHDLEHLAQIRGVLEGLVMTTRTFVTWVEPLAQQFQGGRSELLNFARTLPPPAWHDASPVAGWTYRDLLAHLAAGNDKQVQKLLSAVIERHPVDPSWFGEDAQNARNIAERRDATIDELIAELERDGEDILHLLSQLTEKHESLRQGDFPQSFGEALPLFTQHDREHLAQLKTALDHVML